jgi:oligoribonuclease NrnB/cAMP/cGMP phosphodiesterase (DHH superfamily)
MSTPRTVILYHAKCPDGFGGAYAAWKKFGDAAEYIAVAYGKPVPSNLAGAHVYFIDFCYEQEVMDRIVAEAAGVTVLDHHLGTRPVTESMPEHVFDNDRSGATIAWTYFHPNTPVPSLLNFIEDDDIYRFSFPDTRAVLAYLIVQPYEFETWDALIKELDDRQNRETFFVKARTYAEYFALLAKYAAAQAKLVSFEGYECFFANSHPLITMKSAVGALLWEKQPPISLVVSAHPEGFGVSIRGNGTVDVAEIARKYGGNGHPNAAGFQISLGTPMPWTLIEEVPTHETPLN